MSPELIAKLMGEIPEMREFISFIHSEVNRLNTLQDFEKVKPEDMATEVIARKRAIGVLEKILDPLLNSTERVEGVSIKEYLVD